MQITRLLLLRNQGLLLQMQVNLPSDLRNPRSGANGSDPFTDSGHAIDRDLLFDELLYIINLFHPGVSVSPFSCSKTSTQSLKNSSTDSDYGDDAYDESFDLLNGDYDCNGGDDDDDDYGDAIELDQSEEAVEIMGDCNRRLAFYYWRSADGNYSIQLIRKPWPLADRFQAINVQDQAGDFCHTAYLPCVFKYQFYIHTLGN